MAVLALNRPATATDPSYTARAGALPSQARPVRTSIKVAASNSHNLAAQFFPSSIARRCERLANDARTPSCGGSRAYIVLEPVLLSHLE
jgi:hypothetical protein